MNQIQLDLKKIKKIPKKYKEREPLYYYYIIDNEEFKYTCKYKYTKNKLSFYRSDTHCKAKVVYFLESEKLEPENEPHIP